MSIHACYPYLRVSDAPAAIAFYAQVFGATERFRLVDPSDGRIGHAELVLAPGIVIMLSAEYPEMGMVGPSGKPGLSMHLHVDDCDAVFARARVAGATILRPPADPVHGERSGSFVDPFGHEWMVGHSIEEVPEEAMQARWDALVKGG